MTILTYKPYAAIVIDGNEGDRAVMLDYVHAVNYSVRVLNLIHPDVEDLALEYRF
jgi:hypothetical protein